MLEAIAQFPGEAVRRRFYQLRVMDYFARELSLEMEIAQGTPLKAAAGRSGRSSGLPTPASAKVLLMPDQPLTDDP